jgi:ATP-dependent helicase HrpA
MRPDSRALNDGYRLLQELQALDAIAVSPPGQGHGAAAARSAPERERCIESKRFHAESELLAIVSGLSVADVRLGEGTAPKAIGRPAFDDNRSPSSPRWSNYGVPTARRARIHAAHCGLVQGAQVLGCCGFSEWEDVTPRSWNEHANLGSSRAASYTGVHRSLLAGFCTLVGTRGEDGAYLGTRGIHFHMFPGSPLARRRKPRWVMAANIVETSRVFARRVAQVEPPGSKAPLRTC